MGTLHSGHYRPQRTLSLYVVEMRLLEGGLMTTKVTNYPKGDIGAVLPLLAWDGLHSGPELPIVQQELIAVYQSLAALHIEQQSQP